MMNNPNQNPMNRGMIQPGMQQGQRQMTPQQMQVHISQKNNKLAF